MYETIKMKPIYYDSLLDEVKDIFYNLKMKYSYSIISPWTEHTFYEDVKNYNNRLFHRYRQKDVIIGDYNAYNREIKLSIRKGVKL